MRTDRRIDIVLESHDWEAERGIPVRLPLLDDLEDRLSCDFAGWATVFIQHHLGSPGSGAAWHHGREHR